MKNTRKKPRRRLPNEHTLFDRPSYPIMRGCRNRGSHRFGRSGCSSDAEKEAFAAREKAALNKADSLKNYLTYALQGQKFSTARCAVSFRKSEAVEILDEASIPQNYVVETVSTKPDKKTIKEAIKAGQEVAGCRLVENLNLSIK